ncbi:MAG TPA: TonB-dependent receptor [Rubrivivax sp.]|nr:TonB-dependent receptor [Burkholderiales bacterium]HNU11231.1 TonB-dependent receptor [Rubrivivax sp.]
MPSSSRVRAARASRAAASLRPLHSSPSVLGAAIACSLALLPAGSALAQGAAEQIVVTASRTPQPISSVLADVSVVDRSEIEKSGAQSVAEVLARLPGIEFVRNGGPGASTSVYIRGGETRHTAVYIDGVRVDSQSTGGAAWEQIPIEQIERIEVVRGPAATIYGSDAVAGVVQLFTRRGQWALQASAALTLGSYATRQLQAGLSGAAGGFDYSLSASHGRSDGEDARTAAVVGHNPDRDGWKRSSLQARAGVRIDERQRVEASLLASRLDSAYDDFMPGQDDESKHRLAVTGLSWQARWSETATTRAQLGRTRSTYETQPSFYRTETTLGTALLQHEQRVGAHLLTATLERRDDKLENAPDAFNAGFGGKRHQNALGLGWRADLGAQSLQAQVRRDDDSEFGGKSTGSLSWGLAFAPHWRAHATVASSFRVPTIYQRFSPYGNPGLVPETGRNAELGLRWADGENTLSLGVWRNRLRNLINFGAAGPCADAFGCYENIGRAQLKGVTLSGRTRVSGLTLRGSMDWHDPRDVASDKILARRARRLASFGAETTWAGWTLGTEVQAVGRRYDNAANTRVLGGYALLGLYASRSIVAGWVLDARIDNLGDKAYERVYGYTTPGRNAQVSLRWTLP